MSHLVEMLGKAPLTSRKSAETTSFLCHASLMNLTTRCKESVVEQLGRPPKC